MISDIGLALPQLSADAAEFFGQAVDTVSDTFSQIGDQAYELSQQAYRFFSDLTGAVSEQASKNSEIVSDTFSEAASSVSKVAVNISRYVADIFTSFAQWAQGNPAYAIGGLVGIIAAGFGIYYLAGAARIHYKNVTTENRLQAVVNRCQTAVDKAIEKQAESKKILDKARSNYFSAYGYRHLIQHHRDFFPVQEEVSVESRDAEITRLGELNSVAADPGDDEPKSIAHYRFLYQKAAERKHEADAELSGKEIDLRVSTNRLNRFHPQPVFNWLTEEFFS